MLSPEMLAAFKRLRADAVRSDPESESRFDKAIDQNYWRNLNKDLAIGSDPSAHAPEPVDLSELEQERQLQTSRNLAEHGYFRWPASFDSQVIGRMRNGVENVRTAGWPAIFSFVYDEFWTVFHAPRLVRTLKSYLGDGYRQTADFWAYYVDPQSGGSGWPPHDDSPQIERRMAIWIPLSDATVDNGCIYVIPQDRLPGTLSSRFREWSSISHGELEVLLHSVTPLPAAAGSILGWHHRLIHWGGRSLALGSPPRISIAVEFLHANAAPARNELPVLDPCVAPEFSMRIRMIAQMILGYTRFEVASSRLAGLAERLLAHTEKA